MPQETQATITQPPPASLGMQLVGITFNPSGDDKVARAKELCSALADLVTEDFHTSESRVPSFLRSAVYTHTLGEILNAQMNAVKCLTFKY